MHKTARQQFLLELLSENGQISISELVERLQVSPDTVRRDLSDLEKRGLVQKNHGGAIALDLPAMNRQGAMRCCPRLSNALARWSRVKSHRVQRYF